MTKPTIEHIVKWQLSGVTPYAAIYMPVCSPRLTAYGSYVGEQAHLDRRPNKI